jgi:uncharacterized protein (DUF2235 family)
MPRSLIVCSDGTWDKPVEHQGTERTCTNVYKLWRGLADADRSGTPQRSFYHEGVGTGGPLDRTFGGAFGAGLAHNLCDCYRFLVLNYEPQDKIYLFGFSRGAYMARSLAGMVRNCGILKPENLDRVGEAFHLYRDRAPRTAPDAERAVEFRGAYSHDAPIHFIGVWDTVGSMGVPVPIPFWRPWWAFHDSVLSSHVVNAYHALGIDEQRGPFKPTLWTRNKQPPKQELKQVWFVGCHRDVGGGTLDSELADITLMWMVSNADACGLAFGPDHFVYAAHPAALDRYEGRTVHPNVEGSIHQSRHGFWKALWRHRRALPYGGSRAGYRLSEQSVSTTAKTRATLGYEGYPPATLRSYLDKKLPITDVAVDSGKEPG